jgi:hypothetical protein
MNLLHNHFLQIYVLFLYTYGKTCESGKINTLTPHGKKMHVKEIYVIFIHLFDSEILLIIDLNKKKRGVNFISEFYS